MHLLATVNKVNIKAVSEAAYGLILTNKFSNYYQDIFSDEDIFNVLNEYKKHQIYILLDAIYFDEDLDLIKEFIHKFKDTKLFFMFSDLGIYQILKEEDLLKRAIYYSYTMVANYVDLFFFKEYPLYGVSPTLEIPLKDVSTIAKNKGIIKIYYQGFGYSLMYQSKRKILSTYAKYKNIDLNISNDMYLIEEKRTDKYKILENERASFIFQSGIHNILEALDEISDVIDYLILDSRFISDDKFVKALKIYNEALCDLDHLNLYNDELMANFDNLSNDFIYEDSIFKKEDF